jgi:hypothetical protein
MVARFAVPNTTAVLQWRQRCCNWAITGRRVRRSTALNAVVVACTLSGCQEDGA